MSKATLQIGHRLEDQATRRVSFILVTWNRAEFLRDALSNARSIVGPNDEMIVVDGASTDSTHEVLDEFVDFIDILVSEPDSNPSEAFNKGLLLAHGRYIKQLTDDDVYYPEAIEQTVQIMDTHPDIGLLVCGGTRQVGADRTYVTVPPGANYGSSPEDLFRFGACGCGFVYRTSVLPLTGLYNPASIAADGEYLEQAIKSNVGVKFCRINMFHHPLYEHSFVIKHEHEHALDMLRIAKQYCSRRFYWRYRLSMLVARLLPAPLVASLRWIFSKTGIRKPAQNIRKQPSWDGGFS